MLLPQFSPLKTGACSRRGWGSRGQPAHRDVAAAPLRGVPSPPPLGFPALSSLLKPSTRGGPAPMGRDKPSPSWGEKERN